MIWMDQDDTCQTSRISFDTPANGNQNAELIYAIKDICDCNDYLYIEGSISNDCDACYFDCNPSEPCGAPTCTVVTAYELCNFEGDSLEIIGSVDCLDWQPQSICIPDGMQATVYESCWYEDREVLLGATEKCIPDVSGFDLLAKNQNIKSKADNKDKIAKIVSA